MPLTFLFSLTSASFDSADFAFLGQRESAVGKYDYAHVVTAANRNSYLCLFKIREDSSVILNAGLHPVNE